MDDYRTANAESQKGLVELAARLSDEALALPLKGGWTVASTLAHLAFWDRLLRVRWQIELAGGMPVGHDRALSGDLLNDAIDGLLHVVQPAHALQQALDEAAEVDRVIESLPENRVRQAYAAGQRWAVDRSIHRREHIAQIEAVLRRTAS